MAEDMAKAKTVFLSEGRKNYIQELRGRKRTDDEGDMDDTIKGCFPEMKTLRNELGCAFCAAPALKTFPCYQCNNRNGAHLICKPCGDLISVCPKKEGGDGDGPCCGEQIFVPKLKWMQCLAEFGDFESYPDKKDWSASSEDVPKMVSSGNGNVETDEDVGLTGDGGTVQDFSHNDADSADSQNLRNDLKYMKKMMGRFSPEK